MARGEVAGGAVLAVARQRLRRGRTATVALLLLTGVAAAVPMALWASARETGTALDRFLERAGSPTTTVIICPPRHDVAALGPQKCFEHDSAEELAVLRTLPGVRAASSFSFRPVLVDRYRTDTGGLPAGLGISTLGPGASTGTVAGDPLVIDGRMVGDGADEVVITEPGARSTGLGPGDRVTFRPAPTPAGPPVPDAAVTSTIVGVVRTPIDLLPLPLESIGGPAFHATEGWVRAHAEEIPGFGSTVVWLEDGDVDGFVARARAALPDQQLVAEPLLPEGEVDTIEHATSLESRAGTALAVTAALVVVFFVGQAVSRQSRAEGVDRPMLRAVGMTRSQLAAVPALRWLPVAAGGALLGVLLAWVASALGPIGVARRGVWDRSPHADWPVLLVGGAVTAGLVLAIAAVAGLFRSGGAAEAGRPVPAAAVRSPGLRTGIGLAWASVRRGATLPLVSAVLATALALAAIITAAGSAASLNLVTAEPDRFGAPWDALVSGGGGFESPEETVAAISAVPGITSAAGLAGTDVAMGGDRQVWVQAFHRVGELPTTRPVVVSGRAPSSDREIALGSVTMGDAGASVGEDVQLVPPGAEAPVPFRVVGVVMVTDGFEPNVGDGALVTPGGLARVDPFASQEQEVAIDVVDGRGRAEALEVLRRTVPATMTPFPVPSSLANAERIAELPVLLAAGGGVLAAVTFAHALTVSVRRNRRELAVCRVLGFTRGQIHTAITTQAGLLALAAVVVGLPLGITGARWGWHTMARTFGVATGPLVPAWVVVTAAVATIVVANLAAAPPSRWTTRRRPAEALRTE